MRWEQEGNFIDLSLTEDNSSPSASLVAITNDLRARTRFIVAQPVTFSAADPERREGLPACVYMCAERWGFVCAMSNICPPESSDREVSAGKTRGRKRKGRMSGGRMVTGRLWTN